MGSRMAPYSHLLGSPEHGEDMLKVIKVGKPCLPNNQESFYKSLWKNSHSH